MENTIPHMENLEALSQWVHETLCSQENLLTDQFQTVEMPLIRKGKMCGIQFLLQGPRNVRLGAVWASDHNLIYFYDAQGQRYCKTQLHNRVELPALAELQKSA